MKAETKRKLLTTACRYVLFRVYSVSGALIFIVIEKKDDDSSAENKAIYEEIKKNLTAKYDINVTVFDKVTRELEKASHLLDSEKSDWSFRNSLLFVQSVVTTIGYGHIAPVTVAGRMFCIIFAIIGIPICLAMLAAVGDVLRIAHLTWIQKLEKRFPLIALSCHSKCVIVCGAQTVLVIFIGAAIHTRVDNWSFEQGVYAWFITFSTIGFGDLIPGYQHSGHGVLVYRLFFDVFGLCVVAALLTSLSEILENLKCQKYCFFAFLGIRFEDVQEPTSLEDKKKTFQFDERPETPS